MTRTHSVSSAYYIQDTRAQDIIEPDGDIWPLMIVEEARTEQERATFIQDWSTRNATSI